MVYESSNTASGAPTTPGGLGEDKPNLRDTLDEVTGAAEGTPGLGRTARARVEKVRASAARGLDSAADAMHASGERVASAAHRTGDALASGATYLHMCGRLWSRLTLWPEKDPHHYLRYRIGGS